MYVYTLYIYRYTQISLTKACHGQLVVAALICSEQTTTTTLYCTRRHIAYIENGRQKEKISLSTKHIYQRRRKTYRKTVTVNTQSLLELKEKKNNKKYKEINKNKN